MEASDKILQRIKKMLALANDKGATEGERDNAMRMAHALMAKHNIDMASVEAAGGKGEARGQIRSVFYGRPWARIVCKATAYMLFCEYIFASSPNPKDKRVLHHFIGRKSNALSAVELAQYLVESIIKESRKDGRTLSFQRREFCVGAAHAIAIRVAKIVADATKPPDQKELEDQKTVGTALVLASIYQKEEQENMEVKDKLHPKDSLVKASQGKAVYGGDEYEAGHRYGKNVSLHRQLKQGEEK